MKLIDPRLPLLFAAVFVVWLSISGCGLLVSAAHTPIIPSVIGSVIVVGMSLYFFVRAVRNHERFKKTVHVISYWIIVVWCWGIMLGICMGLLQEFGFTP